MKPVTTAVTAAAALVCAVTGISAAVFTVSVCRPKKREALKPRSKKSPPPMLSGEAAQFTANRDVIRAERAWFEAMPRERVGLVSYDGLRLSAELLAADSPVGSVLLMHGYHATGLDNFAPVLRLYHEAGYNILLPSQRASGMSEGRYITYGARERFDCRDWARWLERHAGADSPIFLHGVSLGSTTVQMASALELPPNVAGIISDCGFTSAWDEIGHVLKKTARLPRFPFLYTADAFARIFARFSFRETSTVAAMRQNTLPVLFIHGDADSFVPTYMTMQSYDACTAEKELFIAPGAGHTMASVVCRDEYTDALLRFLRKHTDVRK